VVRVERDRTPTGQGRIHRRPNRRFEHRRGPSLMVVGGLLVAALLVGLALVSRFGSRDGRPNPLSTTPSTLTGTSDVAGSEPVGVQPADGAPLIQSVLTFDPEGDGVENDQLANAAIDGDPSTAWKTVCYSSKSLGGKSGVGLVVTLSAARHGMLTVDLASAPWQVQVYATAADSLPATVDAWGPPIASDSAPTARPMAVPITTDERQFLVLFTSLGAGPQCSKSNPFQGAISEIRFEASS
jgi:hypothetical protein